MLVLSRNLGEKVRIGSDISFVVVEVKGNRVRIGIDAPAEVSILREELYDPLAEPVGRREHNHKEIHHAAGNP